MQQQRINLDFIFCNRGLYLGESIVVSTCLHECTIGSELSRGAPGVGLYKKRPDCVGSQVEESRVSCAVVLRALQNMTIRIAQNSEVRERACQTYWTLQILCRSAASAAHCMNCYNWIMSRSSPGHCDRCDKLHWVREAGKVRCPSCPATQQCCNA